MHLTEVILKYSLVVNGANNSNKDCMQSRLKRGSTELSPVRKSDKEKKGQYYDVIHQQSKATPNSASYIDDKRKFKEGELVIVKQITSHIGLIKKEPTTGSLNSEQKTSAVVVKSTSSKLPRLLKPFFARIMVSGCSENKENYHF